jgi:signal transduction histidine kinase
MKPTAAAVDPREEPDFVGSEGERDLTPSPASIGANARISTVEPVMSFPAAWLDRMLAVLQDLAFEQGVDAVARALGPALESAVPGVRVGLVVPSRKVSPRATRASSSHPSGSPARASQLPASQSGRHVLWTEPPKSDERVRAARLFPEARFERAVPLAGRFGVAALHFASEDDLFASEASPHVQALDRAAIVASAALARASAEEHASSLEGALRTTEAQMVQAEKLASLGQIAAGMVHELNNPLTSIAAYTDFLLRRAVTRDGPDGDDVERLRRIAESANRMLRFTRDLVSYARPSGDIPMAVQLNVVIDRALAFCEHELVDVGVEVHRLFDPGIGVVRGLPEQLAQVFVNLVTNACHAMARSSEGMDAPTSTPDARVPLVTPRSPVLTVATTRGGDDGAGGHDPSAVTIVVQDSGCGIAPKNLALVFNPFFTTKAAGRGTGLGLSIVKNIVEGHGGRIRAESDTAVGTRFILTFPVEDTGGDAAR